MVSALVVLVKFAAVLMVLLGARELVVEGRARVAQRLHLRLPLWAALAVWAVLAVGGVWAVLD